MVRAISIGGLLTLAVGLFGLAPAPASAQSGAEVCSRNWMPHFSRTGVPRIEVLQAVPGDVNRFKMIHREQFIDLKGLTLYHLKTLNTGLITSSDPWIICILGGSVPLYCSASILRAPMNHPHWACDGRDYRKYPDAVFLTSRLTPTNTDPTQSSSMAAAVAAAMANASAGAGKPAAAGSDPKAAPPAAKSEAPARAKSASARNCLTRTQCESDCFNGRVEGFVSFGADAPNGRNACMAAKNCSSRPASC